MQNKLCIHCFVSGHVQGVWFRASTQEEANKLHLTGWVKNLPDGRVEVLACGDADTLSAFQQWLKKGPEKARVDEVVVEELSWQKYDRFSLF